MIFARETELLSLTQLLLTLFLWGCGGILLVAAVMRPRRGERLMVGLGAGFLLFGTASNSLAQLMPTTAAFWTAAVMLFALGVGAAVRTRKDLPLPGRADLPYLVLFLVCLYVFFLINRGLGIQDDYHNLPLVSVMAAGDIPPHFYLDAPLGLAYHYGLHVMAAWLVAIGGLTPWGAFDLVKAATVALALPLAALWVRRTTSRLGWIAFGTATFAFLGGVRWLLLLAPARWLDAVSANLTLLGSATELGTNLQENMLRPWVVAGSGPLPFPFAFLSGLRPPATSPLGGPSLLPEVALFLLLLLHRRQWRPASAVVFAVLVSSLALSSELMFLVAAGALAGGLLLGVVLGPKRGWARPAVRSVVLILCLALAIGLLQGGVFTQILRAWLGGLAGTPVMSYGFAGVSLVWPPQVVSAHLGGLRITDPSQLLLALLEAGPALLLLPLALVWSWQHLRRGSSFPGGLAPISIALAAVGLIAQYDMLRETSRLPGTALMVWTAFGLQPMTVFLRDSRGMARVALAGCLLLGMFAGPVLLATQLVAAAKPTRTYFANGQDSAMANRHWNRLRPDDMVFDPNPYRAVTLFGRPTKSHQSYWATSAEFDRLVAEASPPQIARAGYGYLYMDDEWWAILSPAQQAEFTGGCPRIVDEEGDRTAAFRTLYDLKGCRDSAG